MIGDISKKEGGGGDLQKCVSAFEPFMGPDRRQAACVSTRLIFYYGLLLLIQEVYVIE